MIINPNYEIVEIADEYLAVPVGDATISMHGVVALSEATAFLLQEMKTPRSKDELIDILTQVYDVEKSVAAKDVERIISTLLNIGVIIE